MKTNRAISVVSLLMTALGSTSVFAGAPASTPELIEKGKTSYATNCLICHGDKHDGNGPAGAALNPKPRNLVSDKFKKGDKAPQIFKTISEGLAGTTMTGYGHLPEDERWGLTHFIVSLRKK